MRASLAGLARNGFEVLSKLPHHGVGSKLARTTWKEGTHYSITSIKLSQDGAHGKAFGVLSWNGQVSDERPLRISGLLKKEWRAVDGPVPAQESQAAAALRREAAAVTAEAAAVTAEAVA
ncbi:MRPS34 [Auxenochlorella protothecoides x Auxenochlorella symbiontica]